MRSPSLKGILICNRAICDGATGNHTLVDVLLGFAAPQFPCATVLTFYLCMTEVLEPTTLTVRMVRLNDDRELLRGELSVGARPGSAFNPHQVIGIASPPTPVTFEKPGLYEVRVYQDDTVLAAQPFPVHQLQRKAPEN